MGNVNKTGPLSSVPIPSTPKPAAPKGPVNNVDTAAKPAAAEILDSKTADELVKKNTVKQSESAVNEMSFPSKDGGSKISKQEKIDKLSNSMQGTAETLSKKLADDSNNLNETMGVLMKEAKKSLSSEDFDKFNNKLFPTPENDKAKEYKKMISDAIKTFKGSDQPEAAMNNLLQYLSSGAINIVEDNPGC